MRKRKSSSREIVNRQEAEERVNCWRKRLSLNSRVHPDFDYHFVISRFSIVGSKNKGQHSLCSQEKQ